MNLLSIDKVINNFKEFLNYIDQQDEHICLVESLKTITNKEFVKDCNDVRAFLKVKQVNAGDIVVVYCDKNSYEYIMLLTGILSYGAICLPFEPSLLKRSGLTQEALKFNAKVIFVSKDSPMNGCCTINDFQKNSDYVPIHDVNDLTPAMVRQTSGTTGKSKNALIPQCSLLIYLNPNGTLYKNIMQEKYPNDFNVILFSPYTANVLCGLYFSIALGVTAYIEPMSILRNTALLTKRFNEIKPTLICAPQITLPLFYSLPLDTSNLK
jgi:acyl-coenzyme A synthetase/AMP-(fatty) acid ligase